MRQPISPPKDSAKPADQYFRTDYDSYPLDLINRLVEKEADNLDLLFTSDTMETDVSTRVGSNDVQELCSSRSEVIYPTQGKCWLIFTLNCQRKLKISCEWIKNQNFDKKTQAIF